jgi:hypothetical protein
LRLPVGAAAHDGVMGNQRRRQRLAERARAIPLAGERGQGCRCERLVRLAYRASCQACAAVWEAEVLIPSNGVVGDERPVFCSCACGGEAAGTGRIVELLS